MNIVVVNFKSPPSKSIGGRRWGKFSKQILKNGWDLDVITSATYSEGQSRVPEWDKLPGKYYFHHIVEINPLNSIFHQSTGNYHKLKRCVIKWIQQLKINGSIYDEGIGSRNEIHHCLTSIADKKGIDLIVVSGPPFSWCVYTAEWVKFNQKNFKFWVDLRDPWINGKNYGLEALNKRRQNAENVNANFVFSVADFISAPNFKLLEINNFEIENAKARKILLEHFFDPDDFNGFFNTQKQTTRILRGIYAGDFYPEYENQIERWNYFTKAFFDHYLNKVTLELNVYSSAYNKFQKHFHLNNSIKCFPSIHQEIFKELSCADFLIIASSEFNKDFFTTKFFEYLPLRKPILYLGPYGEVQKYLEDNHLGGGVNYWKESNFDFRNYVVGKGDSSYIENSNLNQRFKQWCQYWQKSADGI
jgi:hypothetical protein